eukprot:g27363.t1
MAASPLVSGLQSALCHCLRTEAARQKAGNCRLISLTSVIDKILEFIIKDEIVEYLEVRDDTNLGGRVKYDEDAEIFQHDLDKM